MSVDLQVQRATTSSTAPDDEQFRHWVELALGQEGDKPGKIKQGNRDYILAIRIVDEEEAQRFNHEYRGKDYASNVLSFPADLPAGLPSEIKQASLGDLLICAPVVVREAKQQGKAEKDHWAHLTIHGVLHLRGYDHEQAEEATVMEALETSMLNSLSIPNPY